MPEEEVAVVIHRAPGDVVRETVGVFQARHLFALQRCWIQPPHHALFIDAPTYFGPDRRFKIEGYPGGVGRRKSDNVEVAAESGPALGQGDIDNLFSAARTGRD